MGGSGSGRFYRYEGRKATVEESWAIGIDVFNRDGLLTPGAYYSARTLTWKNGVGDELASIRFDVDMREMDWPVITFRYRVGRGERARSVEYAVTLVATALHRGGVRWWFECPLNGCGRRVGKLYLPPGAVYYGCRQCYNLTYQSCRDSHKYDALAKSLASSTGISFEAVQDFLNGDRKMWDAYRGAKRAQSRRLK